MLKEPAWRQKETQSQGKSQAQVLTALVLSPAHIHTSLPFNEKEQQRSWQELGKDQSCMYMLVGLFTKAQYFYKCSQKDGKGNRVQWQCLQSW